MYSPLPLHAVLPALPLRARTAHDPRPALLNALLHEYDASSGILCGSGTQALTLALQAALRRAGETSRIALPAFCCYDVAAAAIAADAEVVLYDVDPDTLGPDLDSLERALDAGARVVVAAPLYGLPIHWEALRERTDAHGAVVIEDAAQGSGARWRGRPLGSNGELSVLSFGRGKGWTGGRGGALLLRGDAGPARSVELAAATARDEAKTWLVSAIQSALGRPSLYRLPVSLPWLRLGETVYHEASAPAEMPRLAADLLERTRPHAEREAALRRRNAAELLDRLRGSSLARPVRVLESAEPGFLRLPVRLPRGMASLRDPGAALRLGIAPSYPTSLAALPPLQPHLASVVRCVGAEELARTLVTLPTHSRLTIAERDRVLQVLGASGGA